jgi:hypothetical protein
VIPADADRAAGQGAVELLSAPNFNPSARYNYQIPLVGTSSADALQARINKMINPRNSVNGTFGFQRTGAENPNLFQFVDGNHTLGMSLNLSWRHTFNKTSVRHAGRAVQPVLGAQYAVLRQQDQRIGRGGDRRQQSGPAELGAAQPLVQQRICGAERRAGELPAQPDQRAFVFGDVAEAAAQHHHGRRRAADPTQFCWAAGCARQFRIHGRGDAGDGERRGRGRNGQRFRRLSAGVPDTVSIAFGNADKYFARPPTTPISPTIGG